MRMVKQRNTIKLQRGSMLLGLNDFDVDMFLTFEDKNIKIYYSDFETIPELSKIVPLGSFDDETQSYPWIDLDYDVRIQVGLLFMQRDLYIYEDPDTKKLMLNRELDPREPHGDKAAFLTEFYNIPEVIYFFDEYKNICKNSGEIDYPIPNSWIGWDKAAPQTPDNPEGQGWWYQDPNTGAKYIDWNNYPQWCQSCPEYTYDESGPGNPTPKCAFAIPIEVMSPKDLYFISVVYFNGIYRVNPENSQNFGVYQMLTDVDFDLNKFSLIINIKQFFTLEFQWFLQTVPGDIPFACDYGTHIKHAVQTKNTEIRQREIENEINFFIHNFNSIYGELVNVDEIIIVSKDSETGGDEWVVEVYAKIKEERLIYRIEV